MVLEQLASGLPELLLLQELALRTKLLRTSRHVLGAGASGRRANKEPRMASVELRIASARA